MSEAVQGKELTFPDSVRSAGEQLVQLQRQGKLLEKRIKGLKKYLGDNTDKPLVTEETGGSLFTEYAGVTRTAWFAPTTEWANVFKDLEVELSAKAWATVFKVRAKYTTKGYREKFTMEEEEE